MRGIVLPRNINSLIARAGLFPVAFLAVLFAAIAAPVAEGGGVPERAEAYIAALNSGDVATYRQAFNSMRTRSWTTRDEDAYRSFVSKYGRLRVERIVGTGNSAEANCRSMNTGDELTFVFAFTDDERIESISISVGTSTRPKIPDDLPELRADMSPKAFGKNLDRWISSRKQGNEFWGVVLVERNGQRLFNKAYGLANKELGVANTTQTLFRVGSITKSFVQVAVARLIQDGRLTSDATIREVLPQYPRLDIAVDITVDQLLNHRSGLGGMNYRGYLESHAPNIRRPVDYIALFADEPLLFAPGTREEYSNAGYIVLGAVIEAVTGENWERSIETTVFKPAGMKGSCFIDLDRPDRAFASGYWTCDPAQPALLCSNAYRLEVVATAGGGSYGPAEDLIAFETALRSGKLLDPGFTNWYFTRQWPTGDAVPAAQWPASAIAGGAEGVNAILFYDGTWSISILSNVERDGNSSAEDLFAAIGGALGLLGAR